MKQKVTAKKYQVWILIRQLTELFNKLEGINLSEVGISREKHLILVSIKFDRDVIGEAATITSLALELNRSVVNISSIIARCENEGLIIKTKNPSDGRSITLTLTPKAEKLLEETSKPYVELINDLMSVLPDEEQDTLIASLLKIARNANNQFSRKGIKGYYLDPDSLKPDFYRKMFDFLIGLHNG